MCNGNDPDFIDKLDNKYVEFSIEEEDEPRGFNTPKGDEENWIEENRGKSLYE